MGWTGLLGWLLPRRFRSSWPLFAVASFGILAAVTLMAVGAIYSRAIAEGGVRHALSTENPAVLDVQISVANRPLGPADYQKLRQDIEGMAGERVGFLTRELHRLGRTQDNWLVASLANPNPPSSSAPVGRPFFLTGFQEHTRLLDGRWPQTTSTINDGTLELEIAVGQRAATTMQWDLDTQIYLYPFRGDPTQRVLISLVGLVEPIDATEEYWLPAPVYFNVRDEGERSFIPMYMREEAFFSGLGANYPATIGDFTWFLYVDPKVVTASNAGSAEEALTGLETDVNKRFPRSFVSSKLDLVLRDYEKELRLARAPIYLFIGLVVLLILYFLSLVIGLLSRYREEEAGLLRSRGGSILQIGGLLIAAEGIVTLLAIAIGPFLALAIVRYLLINTIDPVGAGESGIPVGISADMFVMGAVGGLLSLMVLVANGFNRARLGMVATLRSRARPPTVPLLHRYYVDVLVVAALGLLWWQISSRGGFVSRDVADKALEVNPTLLFGPVLVLLAVAFIILRVLPVLVNTLAWVMSRVSPPWAAFSMVRLARDPLPHGSLVIILMMAAALGVFGAGFQSTLARSQEERTLFDQGGDLVLHGVRFTQDQEKAVLSVPGVQFGSAINRETIVLLDWLPATAVSLVGFDPDAIAQVSWFREDFADQSLDRLMSPLNRQPETVAPEGPPSLGIAVPRDGATIGAWVNVNELEIGTVPQGLNLWARLRSAEGQYRNLRLGDLVEAKAGVDAIQGLSPGSSATAAGPTPGLAPVSVQNDPGAAPAPQSDGWVYLETALPDDRAEEVFPFTLVSIFITKRSSSAFPPGSIGLDDITVRSLSGSFDTALPGEEIILEGYEDPGAWAVLASHAPQPDLLEYSASAARTGEIGLSFSWTEPLTQNARGVIWPAGPNPLSAVGSSDFYLGQVARFREGKHAVPVVIGALTSLFPTVEPSRPFLLVNLDDYREYVERLPQGTLNASTQIWISPSPASDRQELISSLQSATPMFTPLRDRETLVDTAERNPLAGGGWNGLTILAVSAITVAVLLTLAINGAVAVYVGRVDLTVARAVGFSRVQIFLALALERLLISALGIGIGSAVGVGLGWWVLDQLDITTSGFPVVPPMIYGLQGWLVGVVLGSLATAALLSLVMAAVWVNRLSVPQVLRSAE